MPRVAGSRALFRRLRLAGGEEEGGGTCETTEHRNLGEMIVPGLLARFFRQCDLGPANDAGGRLRQLLAGRARLRT